MDRHDRQFFVFHRNPFQIFEIRQSRENINLLNFSVPDKNRFMETNFLRDAVSGKVRISQVVWFVSVPGRNSGGETAYC